MTATTADAPGTPGAEASVLEVWGDPIAHSLSPRLHAAAYRELGWAWQYGRRRVAADEFAAEIAGLGLAYRGLSITFPLKAEAFAAATRLDETSVLTGAANTLVLRGGERLGFNTDVDGLVADLTEQGVAGLAEARIVGAGATATSALVALARLGADRVEVLARRPEAAAPLIGLGERLGVGISVATLLGSDGGPVPLTLSTLPGGAELPADAAARLAGDGGLLYDVVYGHWPTVLADAWQRAGAPAVDGRGMLLQQAVRQIRAFATGEVTEPLPREQDVVAIMRSALMED